jgi:hypothetical protein
MERPPIKDKAALAYVNYLEEKLSKLESSDYVNTYYTIAAQIRSFNEQLTINMDEDIVKNIGVTESGIVVTEKTKKGFINLFADKDDKSFDRAWKYMLESVDMNKKLDELRKLMNPEQEKELKEKLQMENLGLAEKLAMNNRK